MVGLCWSGIIFSQETNKTDLITKETNMFAKPFIPETETSDMIAILRENGRFFGCHFTLEYQGADITGIQPKARAPIRTDLSADSFPSFLSQLRAYLDRYDVVQDTKNPKIVHIIEKVLAHDTNYPLNKRLTLTYTGGLHSGYVPIKAKPLTGPDSTNLGGLVRQVGARIDGIIEPYGFTGPERSDSTTEVKVAATNETVRSIFTDCLPTTNYFAVMWLAETTMVNGNKRVVVEFCGPDH
jgi:hypothetical protein